jgi:glycosyltransferase involved in cell wall biosynthesis
MEDRPLSILHLLSYPWFTGPAEPVLALAAAQKAAGHQVLFACDTIREGDLWERAKHFGVPVDDRFALSSKSGPILLLRDVLALKRLWATGSVDILHCHRSHDHSLAALSRPRVSKTRLVRTLHTERSASGRRRWQLKRADGLITVAKKFKDRLDSMEFMDAERIVTIEGAVDTRRFSPGSGGEAVRAEVGIAPDAPVALIVARMKPDRGHILLLEAWKQVAHALPKARLMVAGRGELEEKLGAFVRDANLNHEVSFLGYRRDLPEVYRAADLKVILAPGNDGTCRAALEAMASGVPVLASAQGALPEIVVPGVTGQIVAEENPKAWAESLIQLLSNEENLRRMGKNARSEAERRFTLSRQFEIVESLYRRVLDSVGK